MPGTRASRRSSSRRGPPPAAFHSPSSVFSSRMTSSPSPSKKASTTSASGSGTSAPEPPPKTIGAPSSRSAASTGRPARSSMFRTLLYVSSYESENPNASNSPSGCRLSRLKRGTPCRRNDASMSGQGA